MSTTIEILQAYPLGTLEVEVGYHDGHKPERGTLLGLMLPDKTMKGRSAKVLFADGLARWVEAEALSAVLRPFSALCTPLEDGMVPAVEVAKIEVTDWGRANVKWQDTTATLHDGFICVDFQDGGLFYLHPDMRGLEFGAINYLRSKHFAVGLTPAQFIEK